MTAGLHLTVGNVTTIFREIFTLEGSEIRGRFQDILLEIRIKLAVRLDEKFFFLAGDCFFETQAKFCNVKHDDSPRVICTQ